MPITYHTLTDIAQIKTIWNSLTPNESIYDTWDFRWCFYKYDHFPVLSIVAQDGNSPVALLALQRNEPKNVYEFFGGSYMEGNRVLYRPGYEAVIPTLFTHIPGNAELIAITATDPTTSALPVTDHKYVLPLSTYKTHEDFIEEKFQGDTKKKLKKRIRKVAEENTIEIIENNFEDIELMFEWNIARFKDDSSFNDENRKKVFRDLLEQPFQPKMLTFVVNGQKQAVALGLLHGTNFASFNSGLAPDAVENLSEFVRVKKIDYVISLGATMYDAFTGTYGWKDRWHFDQIPQHTYKNFE